MVRIWDLQRKFCYKNLKGYPGPRSPVVLPYWGGEVGCSTRGEGEAEACPGPVTRYRQRLAPGLGGGTARSTPG